MLAICSADRDHYYQRVTNVTVIVAEYVFLHVAETIHSLF